MATITAKSIRAQKGAQAERDYQDNLYGKELVQEAQDTFTSDTAEFFSEPLEPVIKEKSTEVITFRPKIRNPIAKEVQDVFDGIYGQVNDFVRNPEAAINGIIVSGDAGTGKTYTVKKALKDTGHQKNVEYIKGGKITAASLYVKLYLNRFKHRIIVLDDCDIIHHSDKNMIVPMLLGAAELGQNRSVSWETARRNPLMEEHNVPGTFKFEGKIIWITNDKRTQIAKAVKQWAMAIDSRFLFAPCYFTDEQKFSYTMYLVEHCEMLGKKCEEYRGGYPAEIIESALDYMGENYRQLVEITPRRAIMIADIMNQCPDDNTRKTRLRQLWK